MNFGERKKATMTCAEFQKVLPYTIDAGATSEQEAHLQMCAKCSDLVQDLRYIAEQAKLLVPMHDPSPRVWTNIQRSLEQERAASPRRIAAPGQTSHASIWRGVGWAAAAAAMILLAFTLMRPNLRTDRAPVIATNQPVPQQPSNVAVDNDDIQLLQAVAQHQPQLRPTYESSLRAVNTSIADARRTLEQNPQDDAAREHLNHALDQKAMLYEMALSGR
jgi:hypothetical protein